MNKWNITNESYIENELKRNKIPKKYITQPRTIRADQSRASTVDTHIQRIKI